MFFMAVRNNKALRFAVCLVLCIALVFCQVLSVPAQAVVFEGAFAFYVVQTVLLTLGYNLAVDWAGTIEIINSLVLEIGGAAKKAFDAIVLAVKYEMAATEVLLGPRLTVDVLYEDYVALANYISEWMTGKIENNVISVSRVEAAPLTNCVSYMIDNFNFSAAFKNKKLEILSKCQQYMGEYSNWYFCTQVDPKLGTRSLVVGFFSGDLQVLSPSICETYTSDGYKVFFGLASRSATNVTMKWRADGTVTYSASSGSEWSDFDVYFSSVGSSFYQWGANCNIDTAVSSAGVAMGGTKFNAVADTVISVDAPVTMDTVYAPGVVAGAWNDLITKEGDTVISLPFNFPVTDDSAMNSTAADVLPKDLVQSGSADVPSDIPDLDIDSIKLPSLIITKFPFCIPFDLAKGIAILNTSPKTPRFVIPLEYGTILNEEIVLDFDDFERVIAFIRWGEIFAFTFGLLAVTRSFIKW